MGIERACRRVAISLLLGSVGAIASPVLAQNNPPHLTPRTPDERHRQYEEQRRITIAAMVTDASGAPIVGLTPDDFALIENGKPRKLLGFQEVRDAGSAQVHGIVVIDVINNDTPSVKRQVKVIGIFLAHHTLLPFPIAIAAATEGGMLEGDPSTDPAALRKDLDLRAAEIQGHSCDTVAPGNDMQSRMGSGIPASAQGASGLTRADCRQAHFLQSMNALHELFAEQENARGRAIVIWLGPGWPLPQSHESGLVTGDTTARSDAGDMAVTLTADIRHGQVTFDGISWNEFERDKGLRRKGAVKDIDAASQSEQEAMLTIPALAEQSGGLALAKSKDLADSFEHCLRDAHSFYTLSFDPAVATKTDEFRILDVTVDKPGARVRTLRSYFEEPE